MRLKPRAIRIDAVGDYAMVKRTSSSELTKRVAFTTQNRATLFTIDQEGHLHAGDDVAVITDSATANTQVHFILELAWMDQSCSSAKQMRVSNCSALLAAYRRNFLFACRRMYVTAFSWLILGKVVLTAKKEGISWMCNGNGHILLNI
jgi:hypothetical protein